MKPIAHLIKDKNKIAKDMNFEDAIEGYCSFILDILFVDSLELQQKLLNETLPTI